MNVAIVSRLRMGIGNLRERLAGREDSEHVDALVRIALVLVICTMPYYGSVLLKRIRVAQDKAALANAAQRRLLSLMRYDIRNLLTSITDNNAALRKTPLTSRQLDLIDTQGTASEILLSRLDNGLDLARIEAGKITSGHGKFDWHAVINRALKSAATRAAGMKAFLTKPIKAEVLFQTIGARKCAPDCHGDETEGIQRTASEPVLDHAVLAELEQCANSPQFVAHVFDAFESDMLGLIERLKLAVKSEDWPEIAEIRHAIEETARNSGAAAIVGLIGSLRSLDAVEPTEREKRVGELCACFTTTLDAMREFLARRKNKTVVITS